MILTEVIDLEKQAIAHARQENATVAVVQSRFRDVLPELVRTHILPIY